MELDAASSLGAMPGASTFQASMDLSPHYFPWELGLGSGLAVGPASLDFPSSKAPWSFSGAFSSVSFPTEWM